MKKNLLIAVMMTVVTTLLLGIVYPLAVTGIAQVLFPHKANGQLISQNGKLIGSHIIGQPFVGPGYFHSRPSAAGTGYDATASGGTNLGPTNKVLVDRVAQDSKTLQAENPNVPVPIDLVTTSASGLDPHISIAAAQFQVPRVARVRGLPAPRLLELIAANTEGRQFGFLGEPRVNVLELNLALDRESNPVAAQP
jgi:potassium-transporting ATPase KdpC subunit